MRRKIRYGELVEIEFWKRIRQKEKEKAEKESKQQQRMMAMQVDLKELIEISNDGLETIKKTFRIDDTEYVIYIRKTYDIIFFGAWTKRHYSKQRYAGESWEFAKVSGGCYVEQRWFEENLEAGYCNGDILYYKELPAKQFFQLLEEFIEWYNQTEDGSIGVLEVLDLVKSYFGRVGDRYEQVSNA